MAAGAAVRIADPDTGELLGPDAVGEILAKSHVPMIGYLNRPEENAKFFGADGFCHTGDLGHYDEKGVLYFDGRIKDLIKVQNQHLYPKEIEDVIQGLPGVEDVAVFGRADPAWMELITALVVRDKSGAEVDEQAVVDHVERNVSDHKRLRGGVLFVEKIPRNNNGKILRRELLEFVQK